MNESNLSRREGAVLETVIEFFLKKGEPVASREVAAGQRLSPASIRSVMGRLEDAGLLSRPHSSAGCVPTDSGLRIYINRNVRTGKPPASVRRKVEDRFRRLRTVALDDLGSVAAITAELTCEAGIAVRPVGQDPVLESVTLVPLGSSRILAVLVTDSGWIDEHVGRLEEDELSVDLAALAAMVNRKFSGRGIDRIRRFLSRETPETSDFSLGEIRFLRELFRDPGDGEVEVAGTENLIENDAFAEVDRIRSVVRVLEDRSRLAGEWRRALSGETTRVFIGEESPLTAEGNLGMVATLFFQGGHTVGAVGIVGPRRMSYRHVVPVVECIGETLSHYLEAACAAG